jgi:yeast amino acid transporter
MGYWVSPEKVHPAVWITIFYLFITGINLFGVRGYAEAESIFSFIKVTAVLGFIVLGIVIIAGGSPSHEVFGGKTWIDPGTSHPLRSSETGAFNNGISGICAVFVTAALAFGGTELAGVAAAETVTLS